MSASLHSFSINNFKLVRIKNDKEVKRILQIKQNAYNFHQKMVLLFFYIPSCDKSKTLFPIIQNYASRKDNCLIGMCNLNTQKNKPLIQKSIKTIIPLDSTPTLIFYFNSLPFMKYQGELYQHQFDSFMKQCITQCQNLLLEQENSTSSSEEEIAFPNYQIQNQNFQIQNQNFQIQNQNHQNFRKENFQKENPNFQKENPNFQKENPNFQKENPNFQKENPNFQNHIIMTIKQYMFVIQNMVKEIKFIVNVMAQYVHTLNQVNLVTYQNVNVQYSELPERKKYYRKCKKTRYPFGFCTGLQQCATDDNG
eukprot:Pgem_evm1s10752